MDRKHLAWFDIKSGAWMAEWAGEVPDAPISPSLIGDARLAVLNDWQQVVQARALSGELPGDVVTSPELRFAAPESLVCVDVTTFDWPLGDQRWHIWRDKERLLDWGEEHTFIEVQLDTLEVVANQRSHRPVRPAPGHVVVDVTGSPMAELFPRIWGRFVWAAEQWGFEPSQRIENQVAQLALAEAPIDIIAEQLTADEAVMSTARISQAPG